MAFFQFLDKNISYLILAFFLIVAAVMISLFLIKRNRMWLHFLAFTGGFFALNYVEALSDNIVGPSARWFTSSALLISLIAALNPFFGLFVQPPVAYLSDRIRTRIGQRKPFSIASMSLLALALLCVPFAPNLWMLVLFIALYQMANDMGFASFFPLLGDLFPEKYRGRAAMMQETASSVGKFFGATVGGMLYGKCAGLLTAQGSSNAGAGGPYPIQPEFFLNPFSIGALTVIIGYSITILLVKEPKREPLPYEPFSFVAYFKQLAVSRPLFKLYWVILLIAVMNTLIAQYWTLYASSQLGITVERASQIVRWFYVVNLMSVPLFAWISDYTGRRPLLIVGACFWLAGTVGGTLVRDPEQVNFFFAFFVLMGLGWSGMIGPLMPFLIDMVPKQKFGQYCGALMIFRGGSRLVIMPLIGTIIQALPRTAAGEPNWYIIWPLSALASVACIVLLLSIKPIRKDPAAETAG